MASDIISVIEYTLKQGSKDAGRRPLEQKNNPLEKPGSHKQTYLASGVSPKPPNRKAKVTRQTPASACASWGASPTNSTLRYVTTHARQRRPAVRPVLQSRICTLYRRRQWFLLAQNTCHIQGTPAVSNVTAASDNRDGRTLLMLGRFGSGSLLTMVTAHGGLTATTGRHQVPDRVTAFRVGAGVVKCVDC